jgi:uncharacterized protein (DUF1684 family)
VTLGSAEVNTIVFPDPAPAKFGSIINDQSGYSFLPNEDALITANGKEIAGKISMDNDLSENGPTMIEWKNFRWYLINRQDQHFLRVKDTLSDFRQNLKEVPSYTYDQTFVIEATFREAAVADTISFNNVLGMRFADRPAGFLQFTIEGKEFELVALDGGEQALFVIFSDKTTGYKTYGGGRYIYPRRADQSGKVILDFNKAINPPCVFTPYATCPLPPIENHLEIEIRAGEQYVQLF